MQPRWNRKWGEEVGGRGKEEEDDVLAFCCFVCLEGRAIGGQWEAKGDQAIV